VHEEALDAGEVVDGKVDADKKWIVAKWQFMEVLCNRSGQSLSNERKKMKIAVTAQGKELSSEIDPRFGRAKWLIVIDTETGDFEAHNNEVNLNAVQGAGIQTGRNIANLGVEAVITGNVGPNAFKTLNAAGIKIFLADKQTVQQAIDSFKAGKLEEANTANVEGHWI
jgi:predicted Fe-Mo cluster-binding NifX family protein